MPFKKVRPSVETTVRGAVVSTRELTKAEGLAQLAILTCRSNLIPDTDILALYGRDDPKADGYYTRNLVKAGITDVTAADVKREIRRLLSN